MHFSVHVRTSAQFYHLLKFAYFSILFCPTFHNKDVKLPEVRFDDNASVQIYGRTVLLLGYIVHIVRRERDGINAKDVRYCEVIF